MVGHLAASVVGRRGCRRAGRSLVGIIFSGFLQGALRNPAEAPKQFGNLIFGFAVTEALGIFSLLIALLLLYAI